MPELFIGLMSGTSLDGIDAVIAQCGDSTAQLVEACHQPFSAGLRAQLLTLQSPSENELHHAALAASRLSHAYADCAQQVMKAAGAEARAVRAIGCHGQTVRHQPASGYTIQLVNGALLAELAGIDVVCDFRSRDVAAGGQGAPLAPAFHHAFFAGAEHRAIVNIGGIANLTSLPPSGAVTGFDCGPGNVLLDAWISRHLQRGYDAGGAWAASGTSLPDLLQVLLEHEFFRLPPPKSTGRETFNLAWLDAQLKGNENPADVQSTLLALTAHAISGAIDSHCAGAGEIYISGGGARNTALLGAIAGLLPGRTVTTTDRMGVSAEHVEALGFAWLARQMLTGRCGNLPAVSGARGPRILGALHRA